jgi:hypothetical protein
MKEKEDPHKGGNGYGKNKKPEQIYFCRAGAGIA